MTMKSLICILILAHVVYGKILPEYASQYVCRRSDPNISDCLLENINKAIVDIVPRGIPEVGFPILDPLIIPFCTAEGDLESVQVKMIMKNTTLHGGVHTTVSRFSLDPVSLTGEVVFSIPYMRMTTEYYATGRLFVIPLESNAFFDGNFTGLDMAVKFNARTVQRKGIKYFTVNKLGFKGRIETAHIKLTSIDPTQQPAVNVLQNFFNENDRLVLDTVNPLYRESAASFYKQFIEKALRSIPAQELLPN